MGLVKVWEYFNKVAFGGEMVRPPIYLYKNFTIQHKKKSYEVWGAYSLGNRGIWISRVDHKDMYETLYHEMCHQFIIEELEEEYYGHGKLFKDVYHEGLRRLAQANEKTKT